MKKEGPYEAPATPEAEPVFAVGDLVVLNEDRSDRARVGFGGSRIPVVQALKDKYGPGPFKVLRVSSGLPDPEKPDKHVFQNLIISVGEGDDEFKWSANAYWYRRYQSLT